MSYFIYKFGFQYDINPSAFAPSCFRKQKLLTKTCYLNLYLKERFKFNLIYLQKSDWYVSLLMKEIPMHDGGGLCSGVAQIGNDFIFFGRKTQVSFGQTKRYDRVS